MKRDLVPGKLYRITINYPGRFIVTNRKKLVKWSEGFNGVITGIYSHSYKTNKECYDPEQPTSVGTLMAEEWEYWNRKDINPDIEKFWDWIVIRQSDPDNYSLKGVPVSLPINFVTCIEEYVGWVAID